MRAAAAALLQPVRSFMASIGVNDRPPRLDIDTQREREVQLNPNFLGFAVKFGQYGIGKFESKVLLLQVTVAVGL